MKSNSGVTKRLPSWAIGSLIFLVYGILKFLINPHLQFLNGYDSLLTELVFSISVVYFFRSWFSWQPFVEPFQLFEFFLAISGGMFVYLMLRILVVPIPLDLESIPIIILLIFVGPLVEELLFRGALWAALRKIFPSPVFLCVGSAILFSLAHLESYLWVSESYRPFVLVQGFYTLLLGLWWGARLYKYRSPTFTFLLHLGVNAGFVLAHHLFR